MPNRPSPVHPSRRDFVRRAGLAALLPLAPTGLPSPASGPNRTPASLPWPDDPRHDPERVAAMVGASHGNMDVVRDLVEEQPALAKVSWDWGFGDWETPLGAASHVGRRDIAELLIAHGARPTLFSAAMMGQLDVVRAFLEVDPALFRTHGPHGISLVRHARAGGPEAEHVVDYLLERFGPDPVPFGFEPDEEAAARYSGRYRSEEPDAFTLVVGVRNGMLMIGTGDSPTMRMLPVDTQPHTFRPTGAPAVRVRFALEGERAGELSVEDGQFAWRGRRDRTPADALFP